MRYSDIIKIRSMRPAYNIKEERRDDWKSFIANDQFNELLNKMIKAVINNDADNHKSVWISGTYGSGKSHAGAVLKHLFCDPIDDIREYIDEEYKDDKYATLRTSLYKVRAKKRLFPVELYGQQNIAHQEDLSLQLQKEISLALHKSGIDLAVKTDFDTLIEHIDQQPAIWQSLIDENTVLSSVAPDLFKLRQLLSNYDTEVLDRVRSAQRNVGIDIRLRGNKIIQWIIEVQNKLREQGFYDGLLIIWDEFTEIMTSSLGTRLIVELQEIEETMMNPDNDSYFLLISHPSALLTLKEEMRQKTIDRYHYIRYNMNPVSAFKIMTKKFKVINQNIYNQRKNNFFSSYSELLDEFSSSSADAQQTIDNIKNLYPLHPSTANLATYYAREAGNSSRSVFEFLASDSIREFLDDEENFDRGRTITCDYLWDYVQKYFESDTARFGAVTERYNSHHLSVEAQGENCSRVFKGILLLNALNNIANSDTVTPSQKNIENLFIGTEAWPHLQKILDYFNEKSIIQRQPNGNFSILFTALPNEEIQTIKEELNSGNFHYTDQVIKFGDTANLFFEKLLRPVTRPLKYQFLSRQVNEYTLLSKIENAQSQTQGYETFLAIFVGKNQEEVFDLKEIANRNSHEDRFSNTTFVVVEMPFGDKEYERFIEYQANATCAQRHSLVNQQKTYTKNASEMIQEWCNWMRSHNVTFYLRGDNISRVGSQMPSTINLAIAPTIFCAGPESLDGIKVNSSVTYWKKASVKATVGAILSFNTKTDILNSPACSGQGRHVEYLLQDSVNEDLSWKSDINPKHPLKVVCDYIDEYLSGRHTNKNTTFNLGDKLIGLTEPPYGLFQSFAPMAMVAFAMRKYVNQIYDTNGKPRTAQHLVGDVVEMFSAWEKGKSSNKLNFMFESKEAGKLSKNLITMFFLKKLKGYTDISSLKDARWAITHEYAQSKGFPIWSLKYCGSEFVSDDMKRLIDDVIKVVSDSESMKNPSLLSETVDAYNQLKLDWGNLMVENGGKNYETGFFNFLKAVDRVNLQDDEEEDAFNYIKQHLEGAVGLWNENEVADALKDWRLDSNSAHEPQLSVTPGTPLLGSTSIPPIPVSTPATPQKRQQLKERLKMTPAQEVKEIMDEMISKENDNVLDIIMKYVQGSN